MATRAISSVRPTAPTPRPALDLEVPNEGEALVEALRLGVTFYAVTVSRGSGLFRTKADSRMRLTYRGLYVLFECVQNLGSHYHAENSG